MSGIEAGLGGSAVMRGLASNVEARGLAKGKMARGLASDVVAGLGGSAGPNERHGGGARWYGDTRYGSTLVRCGARALVGARLTV